MSVEVRNADRKKCTVGCVNNYNLLKLRPEYQELFNILYELGEFGINPPEAGNTITNFWLPTISETTVKGVTTKAGFLTFTNVPDDSTTVDPEEPFYTLDQTGLVLVTNFPLLISEFEWESDVTVELTFMSQPYTPDYYDQTRVYPILNVDNELMTVKGKKGCVRTQEYTNIFVYANRPCSLTMTINAINPLSYVAPPLVGDTPVPTTAEICCVETPVAFSVLNETQNVVYTAARGFEKLASYIKRTVEYFSQPNPLLTVERSAAQQTEQFFIIWQKVRTRPYGSNVLVPLTWWSEVNGSTDQYGEPTQFNAKAHGLGPIDKFYKSVSQYAKIECTLTFTPSSPQDVARIYRRIRIWLCQPSNFTETVLKDINRVDLRVAGVEPKLDETGTNVIYGATFSMNAISSVTPSFAIVYDVDRVQPPNVFSNPPKDATWKVKVTFPPRPQDGVYPNPTTVWDPYSFIVTPITASSVVQPPVFDATVGQALLLEGGGGGAGGVRYSIGDNLIAESGGGGGRGTYGITGMFRMAEINAITGIYSNRPLTATIGKGGEGGSGADLNKILGGQGGRTSLSSPVNTGDIGVQSDSNVGTLLNGGLGGGGGAAKAVSNPDVVTTYGLGGAGVQGFPGKDAKVGMGGAGGAGGDPVFPGVVRPVVDGKPGTESSIPAGGGAGGLRFLDSNGAQVTRGGGGSGGDITQAGTIPFAAGQPGEDGYISLVSRYIM